MPKSREHQEIKDLFSGWDVNHTGGIRHTDLRNILRELSPNFTEADLDTIFYHKSSGNESYDCFLDWLYDDEGVPKFIRELSKLVGRSGVSRLMLKSSNAGYRELTAWMKCDSPSPKTTLHASDSTVAMQALDLWNISGSKVYTYAGLDVLSKHDQVSAVGVLMLDRYAIQERVGDPASPFTWWPYQAFYVIPKGVDFTMCKKVGSQGKDAAANLPNETKTICNALSALADVAAEEGKSRLFVTGDCGYYALAVESYVKVLTGMGWVQKGDAAFCAPSFRVKDKIDVFLCLGTTQMISTADPTKNIVSRLENTRMFYGTADLRGWYGGDVLAELNQAYPTPERMNTVLRANEGLLWGTILADSPVRDWPKIYVDMINIIVEFTVGSIPFLLGAYIGFHTKIDDGSATAAARQWENIPKQGRSLLEKLKNNFGEFEKFIKPICMACFKKGIKDGVFRKGENTDVEKITDSDVKPDEWLAIFIYLCGVAEKLPESEQEMWGYFSKRYEHAIKDLCNFDEGVDALPEWDNTVILGPRYVEWYCKFNVRLNRTTCKNAFDAGKVGHAIDGNQVFLLDCKFIPGFGKQVADGLTVWCFSCFYWWLSYIYAGFVTEVNKECGNKPMVYHLECTELFNFTDFLHQNGVPVIDNPNYMFLASKSTGEPLRFERYSRTEAPAALMFNSGTWYRDSDIPLRTPEHDGGHFRQHQGVVFPEGIKGLPGEEWEKCVKACCKVGAATMGHGHGQHLYIGSTEIVGKYVGQPREFDPYRLQGVVNYEP